jgi:hypothetical protein
MTLKAAAMPSQHIQDFFEDRARGGDGAFAIAYALLELAEASKKTTRALDALAFNDAGHEPGIFEKLAMETERIAIALERGCVFADGRLLGSMSWSSTPTA